MTRESIIIDPPKPPSPRQPPAPAIVTPTQNTEEEILTTSIPFESNNSNNNSKTDDDLESFVNPMKSPIRPINTTPTEERGYSPLLNKFKKPNALAMGRGGKKI